MADKLALVTGASKGIGAAIATGLAADGFDIWLNYRSDHDAADQVAADVAAAGAACTKLSFDVADDAAAAEALEPLLAERTPDVLVNNAGFSQDTMMFWMSRDEWSDVLNVHLNGFFFVTKLVLGGMLTRRSGRIINIVSTSGQTGLPGQVNYATAKAGLIGATKALAVEVAKRNVLVNAVSPGFIETRMTDDLPLETILPMIPVGRVGKAEDVAAAVRFLSSAGAAYITGQVLSVNGGAYM